MSDSPGARSDSSHFCFPNPGCFKPLGRKFTLEDFVDFKKRLKKLSKIKKKQCGKTSFFLLRSQRERFFLLFLLFTRLSGPPHEDVLFKVKNSSIEYLSRFCFPPCWKESVETFPLVFSPSRSLTLSGGTGVGAAPPEGGATEPPAAAA